MNKKVLLLCGALALVTALSAALLLRKPREPDRPIARVTLDGEVVREIDLDALTAPVTFTVTGKSGLSNTIVAENGSIRVDHADCPDQICVHKGAIRDGSVPIICLPNQLIIEIVGGDSDVDTLIG